MHERESQSRRVGHRGHMSVYKKIKSAVAKTGKLEAKALSQYTSAIDINMSKIKVRVSGHQRNKTPKGRRWVRRRKGAPVKT